MIRSIIRKIYHAVLSVLPASLVLRILYFRQTGHILHLKNPRHFSEKIQHRKLYERDPRMPKLVDKIEVKKFVASRLGPEWIIPTLYAGKQLPPLSERNWRLPYVIKPNDRSQAVLFVRKPSDVNWPLIEKTVSRWMATRSASGTLDRRWATNQIEPRIIVEEYIGGEIAPIDYKFYCFDGRVELIHTETDRETNFKVTFFDRNWKRQNLTRGDPLDTREIPAPSCLAAMIEGAEALASDWSFVRVDLYEYRQRPKFGEMAFYPGSGYNHFNPSEWETVYGDLWRIRHYPPET